MKKTWFSLTRPVCQAKAKQRVDVRVYDDIGAWGVSAKDFHDALYAEAKNTDPIDLHLNSAGGDVFEGLVMYNMLRSHEGEVNVYIDGLAASIASVIAMAGDKVLMPSNAMMMIHSPWTGVIGTAEEMREQAAALDLVAESMAKIYQAKSGMADDDIADLMKGDNWLTAEQAVAYGLADEVLPEKRLSACANVSNLKHVPQALLNSFDEDAKFRASLEKFADTLANINLP